MIVHRTAPRHAPENTTAGIRAAAALGCDAVEIDVRLSADGVPVLVHDAIPWRTLRWPWPVQWTRAQHLCRRPVLRSDELVPTLAEALETARSAGVPLAVDVKDPRAADAVGEVVRLAALEDSVRLWSQHHEVLGRYREAWRAAETALLRDTKTEGQAQQFLDDAMALGVDAISAHWDVVDRRFVERAHDLGLRVYAWHQDELHDLEPKIAAGLDAVVTDYPDEVRTAIEESSSSSSSPE